MSCRPRGSRSPRRPRQAEKRYRGASRWARSRHIQHSGPRRLPSPWPRSTWTWRGGLSPTLSSSPAYKIYGILVLGAGDGLARRISRLMSTSDHPIRDLVTVDEGVGFGTGGKRAPAFRYRSGSVGRTFPPDYTDFSSSGSLDVVAQVEECPDHPTAKVNCFLVSLCYNR